MEFHGLKRCDDRAHTLRAQVALPPRPALNCEDMHTAGPSSLPLLNARCHLTSYRHPCQINSMYLVLREAYLRPGFFCQSFTHFFMNG